jgi:hypothetical protein
VRYIKVKAFATYIPPDDGLLMPETCRGILIKLTKDKQYIELVIIHRVHDARSTQQKMTNLIVACSNLRTFLKTIDTNAATLVNKMCRMNHLTPKYMSITINGNNQQCINTNKNDQILQDQSETEISTSKRKQKNYQQLYQMHLQSAN